MGVVLRRPIARAHIVLHVPRSVHVLPAMMAHALLLRTLTVRAATCAKTKENARQNKENVLRCSMTIVVAPRGVARKVRAWQEKKAAVWQVRTWTALGRSCVRKVVCVPKNLAHASRSKAIVCGLKCANNGACALPCKDNVVSTPTRIALDRCAVVLEVFALNGQVDAWRRLTPIVANPSCARNEAGAKRKKDDACASEDQ